ncbi:MAG: LysE family transporter [Gammaproteobacteria bacterium]|nr:LysE family transporter [Gammaproteobacteria bacterium]
MSLGAAVSTALVLSLLNPYVYLDTVVLIGSISVQELPGAGMLFGTGAAMASMVWFFCLTACGRAMQA